MNFKIACACDIKEIRGILTFINFQIACAFKRTGKEIFTPLILTSVHIVIIWSCQDYFQSWSESSLIMTPFTVAFICVSYLLVTSSFTEGKKGKIKDLQIILMDTKVIVNIIF